MRVILIVLGALALSAVGYVFLTPTAPTGADFFLIVGTSFWRIALLFVAMVLGLFAQSVHVHIGTKEGAIRPLKVIKAVSSSKAFARAVIVSPIVFFAIYNLAKQIPDDVIAFCVSFQNGFFWKAIFEGAQQTPRGSIQSPEKYPVQD